MKASIKPLFAWIEGMRDCSPGGLSWLSWRQQGRGGGSGLGTINPSARGAVTRNLCTCIPWSQHPFSPSVFASCTHLWFCFIGDGELWVRNCFLFCTRRISKPCGEHQALAHCHRGLLLLLTLLYTHSEKEMCAVSRQCIMFWEHHTSLLSHFMCWAVLSLQWKEHPSKVVENKLTTWLHHISVRRHSPIHLFLLYSLHPLCSAFCFPLALYFSSTQCIPGEICSRHLAFSVHSTEE